MLKSILNNKQRLLAIIFLFLLLIAIRAFENTIFYDPFLAYFEDDFTRLKLPQFNIVKLFLSLGFRFYLNSIASIGILYLLFKDSQITKFSIFLYAIVGTILFVSFFFVLNFFGEQHKMLLFNIRRFIIQPIFLLLFIPAFYYNKKTK